MTTFKNNESYKEFYLNLIKAIFSPSGIQFPRAADVVDGSHLQVTHLHVGKPFTVPIGYYGMTKPANSSNKPSPADTPSKRPADNGHKSIVKKRDKQYHADEPDQENIAKRYENEEQPVHPIKKAPKE